MDIEGLSRRADPVDPTLGPEPMCGASGTYWLEGSDEPHGTAPCELAAFHEEPHDWAQHESAIREEAYRAGREEAVKDFLNSVTAYQVGHTVYDPRDVIIVRPEG